MTAEPGRSFLDYVDWAVFGNLCIARLPNGTIMVGLYDGVNHKNRKINRKPLK